MRVAAKKGEHMNEQLLTRLVEALEGINDNLSDIAIHLRSIDTNLDSCVSEFNGLSFFRVAGEITTN